jgi:hypothetical protein
LAYYQTVVGRRKKKHLNASRPQGGRPAVSPQPPVETIPAASGGPAQEERPEQVELPGEGVVLEAWQLEASPMLPYVRMLVRLIAGFRLPGQKLVRWLREALRQHSIATDEGTVYVLRFQHQHPP